MASPAADPGPGTLLAVASGDGAVITLPLPPDGRTPPAGETTGDSAAGVPEAAGSLAAASAREHGRAVVAEPQYLAAHPGGGTLYVASAAGEGTLVALRLRPDGGLDLAGERQAGGANPCHLAVSPDGRHLLAACYGDGVLTAHTLAADGTLGARTDAAALPAPRAPREVERQDGAHPHQVCFDPAGRYALVCDLGGDRVWAVRLDGDTGRLEIAGSTALPPGCGPRHLTFVAGVAGGAGEVHVACELDATVLRCGYAPGTGKLRPLGLAAASQRRTGTAPAGPAVRNYPGAIVASPRHRLSYLTNRGHDTVAVAGLAAAGFAVTETPCGGTWPLDLAVVAGSSPDAPPDPPSQDALLVANRDSGTVIRFALDPQTGAIGPAIGATAVPTPVCLLPVVLSRA